MIKGSNTPASKRQYTDAHQRFSGNEKNRLSVNEQMMISAETYQQVGAILPHK